MFKLLHRGKRGAERAEALLGPRRNDGPALFYRPFILTAWNDRLAGSLRFLPGGAFSPSHRPFRSACVSCRIAAFKSLDLPVCIASASRARAVTQMVLINKHAGRTAVSQAEDFAT